MFCSIPGEPLAIMLRGQDVAASAAGEVDSVALGKLADGRAEVRTVYTSGAVSLHIAATYARQVERFARGGFRAVVANETASVWAAPLTGR